MLFNSLDFLLFLPVVFLLFWFVFSGSVLRQNILIVAASCFFYACWDWRFLGLIVASILVDYFVGLALASEERKPRRKLLLLLSLGVNLGMLGFFKYWNFFIESFAATFSFLGASADSWTLNIVLPVGISFYTFQTLSYTIDIYRRRFEPTRDFIAFFAFVSYFPQLVAGPIERASHLLPQFFTKRSFDLQQARDGMRQVLWGLFKKVVIADGCGAQVDVIFGDPGSQSGSTLLLGAILFTIQIYGDFSGYSDIAIGISRLFGIELMQNFAYPYFSRDFVEFWRRWHISLSTWFRDYLFQPLGGMKKQGWLRVRNVFALYVISGLWHGANWTFVIWGAVHACLFLIFLRLNSNRDRKGIAGEGRWIPSVRELFQIVSTFMLLAVSNVLFRSENIGHVATYYSGLFSSSLLSVPEGWREMMPWIAGFMLVEWLGREQPYAIAKLPMPRWSRWFLYYLILAAVLLADNRQREFIYFQF